MHRITLKLKIVKSRAITPPLCLQGRLQGEYLYLYLYIKQLSKWPQQKKCGRFQNLHDINYQSERLINSVLLTNVKTLDKLWIYSPGM